MSSVAEPQLRHPKLPLRDTIRAAYSSYARNFGDVLQICWVWLAITVPLRWLEAFWTAERTTGLKPAAQAESGPFAMIAFSWVTTFFFVIANVSVAVAWHRRLILDERPKLSGSNIISNSLWRYLKTFLMISLIAILPALVVAVPALLLIFPDVDDGDTGLPSMIAMLLPAMIYLVMWIVGLRLSLLLPARAVTDLELRLRQAWARTRGNTWRMLWGTMACALLPIVASVVLVSLLGFHGADRASAAYAEQSAIVSALYTFCGFLVFPIWIGFLSYTYLHFIEPTSRPADANLLAS